jgi:hypothetical protein
MALWAYKVGRKESAPISVTGLERLVERGALREQSLIRELPDGKWVAIESTSFRSLLHKHFTAAAPQRATEPGILSLAETKIAEIAGVLRTRVANRPAATADQIAGRLTWIIVIACFALPAACMKLIENSVEKTETANRIERDSREKAERDRHEGIQREFRSREVSLSVLKQLMADKQASLNKGINAADKEIIAKDFTDKACKQLHGGKINSWQGYLESISSGGLTVIVVDGIKMVSQVEKSSAVYRQLARFKPNTFMKNGENVTIDGFFEQSQGDAGCLELQSAYSVELTNVR